MAIKQGKKPQKNKKITTTISIRPEIFSDFKKHLVDERRNVSEAIEELMAEHLRQLKRVNGKSSTEPVINEP